MKFAPIVLFTYNRPRHTRQTIEALLKNAEAVNSNLIVFSDGPKRAEDEAKVAEIRKYLRTIRGFKSVCIIERERNFGLAANIISGVTKVVNEYGKVIVLEDDLVTSPWFLRYMNEGLDRFETNDRVISIHGYCYPVSGLPKAFFLKGADCWGWATWKQKWALFEEDGRKLLGELKRKQLLDRFDFYGGYPFSRMLRDQIKGKNQSWAVRWYASALVHDKLTLYPGKTLVRHIGADSGTHCKGGGMEVFESEVSQEPVDLDGLEVAENQEALRRISQFLRRVTHEPFHRWFLRGLRRVIAG